MIKPLKILYKLAAWDIAIEKARQGQPAERIVIAFPEDGGLTPKHLKKRRGGAQK